MTTEKRVYVQKSRAAATQTLRQAVSAAFYDFLLVRWVDEITLDAVAAASGTTRRTVIRLFGDKEGVLKAAIGLLRSEGRSRFVLPKDVKGDAAVRALVEHYEVVGDVVLRLLAQEDLHLALRQAMDHGREEHRAWLLERFAAELGGQGRNGGKFAQLVIATDVYAWKLLRRDLRKTPEEVEHLISSMIACIKEQAL